MAFLDVTRADIAIAILATAAVETAAAFAFGHAYAREDAPAVDPGYAVPVNLVPVVDPGPRLLKLGGGGTLVPQDWQRRPAPARAARPASSRRRRARPLLPKSEPPPVGFIESDAGRDDGATARRASEPLAQAGSNSSDAGPTSADDGLPFGVPGAPVGEGSPEGVPEGTETDPLRAHALALYRSRLKAWFGSRFRVQGSGLPPDALERLRVSATVRIDARRRVTGYSIVPSGNEAFDRAAREALQSVEGLELPPPPSAYPGAVQRQIHITFVCRADTCD